MTNQNRINECLNLVRLGNRKVNDIRFSSGESPEHINAKQRVCEDLIKQGKSFVTEAIFKTGGRADILVLDDFRVIEIVKTEKDESIVIKREKYPAGLRIEVLRLICKADYEICKTFGGYYRVFKVVDNVAVPYSPKEFMTEKEAKMWLKEDEKRRK